MEKVSNEAGYAEAEHDNIPSGFRHWLFGEKYAESPKEKKSKSAKKSSEAQEAIKGDRIRGWFPRKCAVELANPDSDEDQEHFNSKKSKWAAVALRPRTFNSSMNLINLTLYGRSETT